MKALKKTMILLLAAVMIFGLFPLKASQAATKPGKPVITLEALENGTAVKVTIEKTSGAKGYKIVMKAPGEAKYKKIKTLKKTGTAVRTYTVKGLKEGKYAFKVKAYTKSGSKIVYGSYSKAVSISLESSFVVKGDVEIDEINFPDKYFRTYVKEDIDLDRNGKLDETERNINELDVCYIGIRDLKGIEFFTALTDLDCHENQLTSLDVSKNTALEWLDCDNNQLTSLDVSKNTALTMLYCSLNQLTSLDVSKNTALIYLSCGDNQLTSLDVRKNTALTELNCSSNRLTSLDVSKNIALTGFWCFNNQLTSLDVSKNPALIYLSCGDNQLTSLDVSKNPALEWLECHRNQLTSLDVSKNPALTDLNCNGNQLTSLDVSKNTALTRLYCTENQLTSLDVSKNPALTELYCNENQLTSLDVRNCDPDIDVSADENVKIIR